MKLKSERDIASLPDGSVTVIKNGRETAVSIDVAWVIQAARAIQEDGTVWNFRTKADIIEEAINKSRWGLGGCGYTARTTKYHLPSSKW